MAATCLSIVSKAKSVCHQLMVFPVFLFQCIQKPGCFRNLIRHSNRYIQCLITKGSNTHPMCHDRFHVLIQNLYRLCIHGVIYDFHLGICKGCTGLIFDISKGETACIIQSSCLMVQKGFTYHCGIQKYQSSGVPPKLLHGRNPFR